MTTDSAVLYSLPVESVLAWQHSQLVFHFEVLQTHGARLLRGRQTRRSQAGQILSNQLKALTDWLKSTNLPHGDSVSWDRLLKPPEG